MLSSANRDRRRALARARAKEWRIRSALGLAVARVTIGPAVVGLMAKAGRIRADRPPTREELEVALAAFLADLAAK
jgi:hypothetical protein